eukprot:TRINITY_DN6327_c0_g1_i1.p1 TRINITY_DN6327_c0_g1~~TRINITY_DN6327_c0_g1_i1.p1  ORF type:complete len:159 (-),score=17.36 TRINITY_DN6327_c0_g1_i1:530-1006(-)
MHPSSSGTFPEQTPPPAPPSAASSASASSSSSSIAMPASSPASSMATLSARRERVVFVGQLGTGVSEAALIRHFQRCGTVLSVVRPFHSQGFNKGMPRAFAFVEFAEKRAAECAIKKMDGSTLGGKAITVRTSVDSPSAGQKQPMGFSAAQELQDDTA